MMNRDEARNCLGSYLLGELEEAEKLALEQHLSASAELRTELDVLSKTITSLYESAAGPSKAPSIEAEPDLTATSPLSIRFGFKAAAAVFFLVSGAFAAWYLTQHEHSNDNETTPSTRQLSQADSDFSVEVANGAAIAPQLEFSESLKDLPSISASLERIREIGQFDDEALSDGLYESLYRGPGDTVPVELAIVSFEFRLQSLSTNTISETGAAGATRNIIQASPTEGSLRARNVHGESVGEFPLKSTHVQAEISGFLAQTQVRQTFSNSFDEPIEAVYVFPLPTDSAINDFVMEIGGRKIIGIIREKEEAERIYSEAKARGQTASIMTQDRTNLFTQSVANIEPGGEVEVQITYFHTLEYDRDHYEYVFPMVAAPRYSPAQSANLESSSGDQPHEPVPGAPEQIKQAPTTPPELRSGQSIDLEVLVDSGVPLESLRSTTHEIDVENLAPHRARVSLGKKDTIPNRDFVLQFQVAGSQMQSGVLTHRSAGGDGYFAYMMVPPLNPGDVDVTPREVTFIIDSSGSMGGLPIEMSKKVVQETLNSLRPFDRFNIIQFANGSSRLSERVLDKTDDNVAKGLEYLESLEGSGGTEMLEGISAYLDTESDPSYMRLVCFLTDGCIHNESEILDMIRDRGQGVRWFGFGIGSSVNRMLIEGIAESGHGQSIVVIPREREAAEKASRTFFDFIDSPVLNDVTLDWGDLPVGDVYPNKPKDLFQGRPLVIVGRFTGPGEGALTLRGRVGSSPREYKLPVNFADQHEDHSALASVWARHRIRSLTETMNNDNRGEVVGQIKAVALEFRLVSAYTSFVAVDHSRVVSDGNPLTIFQPVPLPEGMPASLAGSSFHAAYRIEAWGLTLGQNSEDGRVLIIGIDPDRSDVAELSLGMALKRIGELEVRSVPHCQQYLWQCAEARVQVTFEGQDQKETTLTMIRP